MKFTSNKDIAKLLRSMSAAYAAKGEDYFKIIAYDKAADSVQHATSEAKDLWDDGKLDTIPGLGKNIQSYLDELFRTGKVKHFQEIKKNLPEGMFELLDIPGMGPKSAYKLAKLLKLRSIEDLKSKAKAGKIRTIEGFGEKSEKDILVSIARLKKRSNRYLLTDAFPVAQRVLEYLRSQKECERAEPLGSLRRMVATVGDIDIAVSSNNPQKIIDHFKKFRETQKILEAGSRTSSIVLKNGMQVDLMVQPPEAFGALLQHFTGSKHHNIKLRSYDNKRGFSLSEHGIKEIKSKIEEKGYKVIDSDSPEETKEKKNLGFFSWQRGHVDRPNGRRRHPESPNRWSQKR